MKTAILLLLRNVGAAFLTRHMVIWLLKLLSQYTDNKIDDHVIGLVDAAFKNDVAGMKASLAKLIERIDLIIKRRRMGVAEET